MYIRPKVRKNQQSRPYTPVFIEAEVEVTDSFPVMAEARETIEKRIFDRNRRAYFLLEQNPEDIFNSKRFILLAEQLQSKEETAVSP